MSKPKVLLTRSLMPAAQSRLASDASIDLIDAGTCDALPRSRLLELLREHTPDGLLCVLTDKIDEEVVDAAGGKLKVVSTVSVGYDHVNVKDLAAQNVRLGNTPGVLTSATADLAVLLVLAVTRRFLASARSLYEGTWGAWSLNWLLGTGLEGKTVGIVGMGAIGLAVAKRLRPFIGDSGSFIYTGPHRKEAAEKELGGATYFASLDEFLPQADIIVVLCSLNDSTKELFTYPKFSLMKKDAIFVNAARGGIVKQDDLVKALEEGMLGGVGLDVMTPEPLPKDDPLTKFERVTLVPHIGSATVETREAMAALAVENVIAGVHGRPMKAEVKLQ